jgi:GTPase
MELLRTAVAEHFRGERVYRRVLLSPGEGRLRAWFFSHAQVVKDEANEQGGWELEVVVPRTDFERLLSRHPGLSKQVCELAGGEAPTRLTAP